MENSEERKGKFSFESLFYKKIKLYLHCVFTMKNFKNPIIYIANNTKWYKWIRLCI